MDHELDKQLATRRQVLTALQAEKRAQQRAEQTLAALEMELRTEKESAAQRRHVDTHVGPTRLNNGHGLARSATYHYRYRCSGVATEV